MPNEMSRNDVLFVDVGPIREIISRIDAGLQNAWGLFMEIGAYVKAQIDIRTAQGVDKDERSFAPYSAQYALFRMESGRSVTPNLFFTGSMMSAMTHTAKASQARIFFMNTTDPKGTPSPLKAYYLNETRNFFAMSQQDVEFTVGMVKEYIDKLLEGPNGN